MRHASQARRSAQPAVSAAERQARDNGKWLGTLLIIYSAVAFGAMAIFARLAYASGVDPATLLFLRFSLASVPLLAMLVARRTPLPRGRLLLALVLMGALGYVGQSFAYFTALSLASASLVALVFYLYPALVTLLSAVFLRERITLARAVAIVLALAGAVLTIGPVGRSQPLGAIFALAAAGIYSIYIVVGSRITPRAGAFTSSSMIILSAGAVYTLIILAKGPALPRTSLGWAAIVAIALFCTVLAIVLFFAGLARTGPTIAATLSTIEPAVTVGLAVPVLGERITAVQVAGGALILAAVIWLARTRH